VEFVKGVREEVKKQGCDDRLNFIRIRPELREGHYMIKAEVKCKEQGSRFGLKGMWACPPLDRYLWDGIKDLYTPRVPSRV
jgi:hypothetical protein